MRRALSLTCFGVVCGMLIVVVLRAALASMYVDLVSPALAHGACMH